MRLTLFVATSLLAVSVLAAPIPATQKEHKVTPLPKKPVKPVVPAKKPDADKPTSDIILDTESVKMMILDFSRMVNDTEAADLWRNSCVMAKRQHKVPAGGVVHYDFRPRGGYTFHRKDPKDDKSPLVRGPVPATAEVFCWYEYYVKGNSGPKHYGDLADDAVAIAKFTPTGQIKKIPTKTAPKVAKGKSATEDKTSTEKNGKKQPKVEHKPAVKKPTPPPAKKTTPVVAKKTTPPKGKGCIKNGLKIEAKYCHEHHAKQPVTKKP